MTMPATAKRLGKALVTAGVITDDQLAEVLGDESGRSLASVLVDLGYASEERIGRAVAEQMGLPYVDLGMYEIDPNAATRLQTDLARRYKVLPIAFQYEALVV